MIKRDWKPFWLGFGIGLFVFLTGTGLLMVDYEGRKLSFGDDTPIARVDRKTYRTELTVRAFGHKETWDVTGLDKAWCFLCDFACLPHK